MADDTGEGLENLGIYGSKMSIKISLTMILFKRNNSLSSQSSIPSFDPLNIPMNHHLNQYQVLLKLFEPPSVLNYLNNYEFVQY